MAWPTTITACLTLWHLNKDGWLAGINIDTKELVEVRIDHHAEYPVSFYGEPAYILFGAGHGSSKVYYKCLTSEELTYDGRAMGHDE